jgi:hypothetical protein
MIVRAQRFYRVHRHLPLIARRTITEETPKIIPNEGIIPSAGVPATEAQETQHVAEMREKLVLRKKAIESLKAAVQKPFSDIQDQLSEAQVPAHEVQRPLPEVHWALVDGYEVGGHLEHGKGPLNRHDQKGLPTWGDWGICVKIIGIGGRTASTVLTL